MARKHRIEFAGAISHVTIRGNDRRDIFTDDIDRYGLLTVFARTVAARGWLCHAYCLMTNHAHFVIETPEPNLAPGMRDFVSGYARRYNDLRGRTGHVFGERYKAVLVQRETHLLELARYVVLNPVRAGACHTPGAWPWSSYGATAGDVACPSFLTVDWLLSQFASDEERARAAYRRFVADGLERWHEIRGVRFVPANVPLAV
jgi:REP element-mobilizing transposase RayT